LGGEATVVRKRELGKGSIQTCYCDTIAFFLVCFSIFCCSHDAKDALPEGFFDDPKIDAKVMKHFLLSHLSNHSLSSPSYPFSLSHTHTDRSERWSTEIQCKRSGKNSRRAFRGRTR